MVKFSSYVLLFDLIGTALIGLPVLWLLDSHVFITILIAFLITTILAIASFYPFIKTGNGSVNKYMSAMLMGMLIRMIFIGLSVVVVFVFTELHQIGFTVALLFSYISKSAIETYFIINKQRGHTSAP